MEKITLQKPQRGDDREGILHRESGRGADKRNGIYVPHKTFLLLEQLCKAIYVEYGQRQRDVCGRYRLGVKSARCGQECLRRQHIYMLRAAAGSIPATDICQVLKILFAIDILHSVGCVSDLGNLRQIN